MSDTTEIAPQTQEVPATAGTLTPTPESGADRAGAQAAKPRRRAGGLSGMLLPQLQQLAGELGIPGTGRMRKSELVAAIQARQTGGTESTVKPSENSAPKASTVRSTVPAPRAAATEPAAPVQAELAVLPVETESAPAASAPARRRRAATRAAGAPDAAAEAGIATATMPVESPTAASAAAPPQTEAPPVRPARERDETSDDAPSAPAGDESGEATDRGRSGGRSEGNRDEGRDGQRRERSRERRPAAEAGRQNEENADRQSGRPNDENAERPQGERPERGERADRQRTDRNRGQSGDRNNQQADRGQSERGQGSAPSDRNSQSNDRNAQPDDGDDDGDGTGRRRRGRFRERNRRGSRDRAGNERFAGDEQQPAVADDDVLIPVAGIVDILDNYAFVRTSGYLTGPNDVYVSMSQVRKNGLRRGDAVTGAVRQPRDGERRDKYNALVRLDTVNGVPPEEARKRPEFHKLTPLYPQERLRLETESNIMTTRIIDLVMPIGKGQRALIVSPPKAGKTMVLQAIANAVAKNNPECYLMVVLVDERPEEVTDMQRSVKGEVIASTFDRPPSDHTTVAELSIERAKRLVELGHDVVVLLDSITRLGRAYNLAAPASGRILSGGVDSTALYPPKRFLGAARNIENGGSLTILATALVETGSTMDTVIFEEFKGTGNAELKLDRKIADKRIFPAVDVDASSTRKEEILLAPDEMAIIHKLRRVLHALDPQQAIEMLLDRLRKSPTNIEFLMQVQKTTVSND